MQDFKDKVAVVTGAASGIGRALAERCIQEGMRVVLADVEEAALVQTEQALKATGAEVLAIRTDVAKAGDVAALAEQTLQTFGAVHLLCNNAGVAAGSTIWESMLADWQWVMDVNLWGVIHGTQVFAPHMIERGRPGLIINTGSKQGITTPPGEPAYNVSKAGVKAFTEALQHELRNTAGCRITAHLLIPGHVFTGLTARGRTEKPPGAWTPEQTVDFMIRSLEAGDFYILCPDNDVPRRLDERRMQWAIGDIVENRPALSRWHPDYAEAFAAFVKKG